VDSFKSTSKEAGSPARGASTKSTKNKEAYSGDQGSKSTRTRRRSSLHGGLSGGERLEHRGVQSKST